MKYELRYDGIVEQSDDFDILKKKSLLLQSEYVIYRVRSSAMNDIVVKTEKPQSVSEPKIKKPKMSERQVAKAIEEIERGYSMTVLAKKYGVSVDTVSRLVRQYQNVHK